MGNGKIGEQLQVSKRAEYKVGKTTQQLGASPTIAQEQRLEDYEIAVAQRSQSLAQLSEPTAEQQKIQDKISSLDERIAVLSEQAVQIGTGRANRSQYNRVVNEIASLRKARMDYEALSSQGYSSSQIQSIVSRQQALRDVQLARQESERYAITPTPTTTKPDIIIGYDDAGLPMSIAPELVPKQPTTTSRNFFDIIKPDVPEVFQSDIRQETKPYIRKVDVVDSNFFSPQSQAQRAKDTALSFGEATKNIFGSLVYNVKKGFSSDNSLVKDKEFRNPFSSFSEGRVNIGTLDAEREIITPQFGTITNEKGYESKSILEFETEKYQKRELETETIRTKYESELGDFASQLNKNIEIGKMDIPTAEGVLKIKTEDINKEFQQETSKVFGKYPLKNDIYEFGSSKLLARGTGIAFETGITAAGFVSPSIPIAYFGSKGIFEAAEGRQKEATIDLAFAGLSSGIGIKTLGKQITKIRLKELEKAPLQFNIKRTLSGNNKVLYEVGGSKTTGVASLEVDTFIPVQQGKKGTFQILTGKGKSNLRVLDYSLEGARGNKYVKVRGFPFERYDIIKAREREVLKSSFTFTTAGSGTSRNAIFGTNLKNVNILQKGLSATTGKGYYTITGGKSYEINFGAAALKGESGYNIIGGSLRRMRYYPGEFRRTALFKLEQRGNLFNENYYKSGEDVFKIINPQSKKKKIIQGLEGSSIIKQPTTKSELQAFSIGSELAEQTSKKLIKQETSKINTKIITRQTSAALATNIPKLAKRTTAKTTPTIRNEIVSKTNIAPRIKTSTIAKTKTREAAKTNSIFRTNQPFRARQGIKLQQKSLSKQKLSIKMIAPPALTIIPPTPTPPITTKLTPRGRGFVYIPSSPRIRATPIKRSSRGRGFTIYRKPSLVALGGNIRASSIKGRETAFSIRPIITKKKKKKRRIF